MFKYQSETDKEYSIKGDQWLFKFDNNHGASVIRNMLSYGHEQGLFELAVIWWEDEDNWHLDYTTPITDDVLGHLDLHDVNILLDEIKKLDK